MYKDSEPVTSPLLSDLPISWLGRGFSAPPGSADVIIMLGAVGAGDVLTSRSLAGPVSQVDLANFHIGKPFLLIKASD